MERKKSEYDLQAEAFLSKHQLRFEILGVTPECPPYCDDPKHIHGNRYFVQFTGDGKPREKPLRFPFWNSFQDEFGNGRPVSGHSRHIPIKPSAYSVLACISSDASCPDTFEEFCADFGYDTDSTKANDTFRRCHKFAKELREFFTPEELEDLAEIA